MTKIISIFLLCGFCNVTNVNAQFGGNWDWNLDSIDLGDLVDDWDWNLDSIDLGDWGDDFDWNLDSLDFGDWFDDFDWNLDSIDFGDWEDDWDWNLDSLDFGDWEDDLDWNIDSIDLGDWVDDLDWNLDSIDLDDWVDDLDWSLDSLDFGDWFDDLDWSLDSLDFGDWEDDLDWNLDSIDLGYWVDDLDWSLDSLDFGDWVDDLDWNLDSLDFGEWEFPCDSLIEFECNGALIKFSVCDIDWEALIDCLDNTVSENEGVEDGDGGLVQQELLQENAALNQRENEDKEEHNNPIIGEIFPNPFIDQLNMNITNYEHGTIEIYIVDVKGGIIHNQEVELTGGGKFIVPINIHTKLPNGMYQIKVLNDDKQIIKTKNVIVLD